MDRSVGQAVGLFGTSTFVQVIDPADPHDPARVGIDLDLDDFRLVCSVGTVWHVALQTGEFIGRRFMVILGDLESLPWRATMSLGAGLLTTLA